MQSSDLVSNFSSIIHGDDDDDIHENGHDDDNDDDDDDDDDHHPYNSTLLMAYIPNIPNHWQEFNIATVYFILSKKAVCLHFVAK